MKKYMKAEKALSILLVLCMLLSYIPVMGHAADAEQPAGDVFVGGIPLVDEQYLDLEGNVSDTMPAGGYAYCESVVKAGGTVVTLTLHDYTYTGIGMETLDGYSGAIYAPNETTIVLEGENIVTAEESQTYYTQGIHALGYLTLKGTGSLDFAAENDTYYDCAISAGADMDIEGGTINCTGADYGIYAVDNLTISGGTITSVGIYEGICVLENLTVSGGSVTAAGYSEGIYGEYDLTVSGGTVNVYSEDDHAVYVNKGNLYVSGGKLTVVTGNAEEYHGIYVNDGSTEISGGSLEALDGGMYSKKNIHLGEGMSVDSPEGGYADECVSVYDSNGNFAYTFVITRSKLKGDLDFDGDVDAEDLTILARHVAGIEVLTDVTALKNADVDGSDEITAEDLTLHARFVAGIITSWDQE